MRTCPPRGWLGTFLLVALSACTSEDLPETPLPEVDALMEQHARFAKRVIDVGGGVHCALGFALANCIMVVVDGGKVIIDTTESVQAAGEIKARFDRIAPGPVRAIVYTHTHPDHVLGCSVFYEPGVPVYAHARAVESMNRQFASLSQTLRYRGDKQFGQVLDPALRISNAIGPSLRLDPGPAPPLIYPTHTFTGTTRFTAGGVTFELHAAPGETHDQLFVWLPDQRILFPGDNVYRSFPNLYATRGVPPRPIRGWIDSLDRMRRLEAVAMVPGHTEPVTGQAAIDDILTAYRDAIQFLNDSVIRMANQGRTPDDMVRDIGLPPHLRRHPYLQELYGNVAWSVRGIYDGYLGWFDGNPSHLHRLHPGERASRLMPLMGGRKGVLAAVQAALGNEDMQWAAELCDILLAHDPADAAARRAKARALRWLGVREANANARSFLLTSALELEGGYHPPKRPAFNRETLRYVPIEAMLASLPERLRPDRTAEVTMTVAFEFTDSGRTFALEIRRGVAELAEREAPAADLVLTTTEDTFKALTSGELRPVVALAKRRLRVTGGLRNLLAFKSYLIQW